MKTRITYLLISILFLSSSIIFSEPGFNGSTPGCNAGGCHIHNSGIVSVVTNGMNIPDQERIVTSMDILRSS